MTVPIVIANWYCPACKRWLAHADLKDRVHDVCGTPAEWREQRIDRWPGLDWDQDDHRVKHRETSHTIGT